ncbi:MAG: hypothetical protein AB7V56_12040 [Candidatus Nitrosocosmicus sp.]
MLRVGSEYVWLWVAIEPETMQILSLSLSKERNIFVFERYPSGLVKIHEKHPVSKTIDILVVPQGQYNHITLSYRHPI